MVSVEELELLFQKFDTRKHPTTLKMPSALRKASVLIPLFRKAGNWHVLLTLRSKQLKSHADTVSFPGGKADGKDRDEVATALREAQEEVGLNPEDVKVLATLPPSLIQTNFVTPVLGVVPDNFVPNPHGGEVQKVFNLPLNRFLNEDFDRKIYPVFNYEAVIYFFKDCIEGEVVTTWGYTAALCIRTALVTLQSSVKRELTIGFPLTKENAFKDNSVITRAYLQKLTPRM